MTEEKRIDAVDRERIAHAETKKALAMAALKNAELHAALVGHELAVKYGVALPFDVKEDGTIVSREGG